MKTLISVIVPIYNVEKYLNECLDSLSHQTFKEYEVICVNDGSTDQSQLIIDDYTQRYSNFKSIIKTNGGLSDARNAGLPQAVGEYISFIDSDDYVEPDFLESMFNKAQETKTLLTVCDIDVFFESDKNSYTLKGLKDISGKTDIQRAFISPLFAWNKLYHRSIFEDKNIRYPLNLWYEDIPVSVPLFSRLDKIGYVDKTLVHYRQRESSIMGSRNSEKIADIFTILELVYNDFVQQNKLNQFHDEIEYLFIEHLLFYGGFRFFRSNKSEEYMNKAFDIMDKYFPHWKSNPYINDVGKYKFYLKLLNKNNWKYFRKLILMRG